MTNQEVQRRFGHTTAAMANLYQVPDLKRDESGAAMIDSLLGHPSHTATGYWAGGSQPPSDRLPVRVQVGIDAAVVANHHVTIRTTSIDGQVEMSRFHIPPTIAGCVNGTVACSRLAARMADN